MQPSGDNYNNPVSSPYELENKNSNPEGEHQLQDIELQLKQNEPKDQETILSMRSIPKTPLYIQTIARYKPIYQPIPMSTEKSTENSQQNLIHHIEDDVPPLKQPESPKIKKAKAKSVKRALKKCCKRDDYMDDEIETIDKVLFVIFLIFIFGTCGLLNVFRVYHDKRSQANLSEISGAISYIAFNLESDPILDIKVQDNAVPCPEDYYSMVLGTWSGTVAGCLCGSYLYRGACDKEHDKGCDDIAPRNPINMFDWGEEKWCVLRAKPGIEYEKAEKCSSGFRKCSSGLCALDSLDCPVTEVKKEGDNFVTEIVEGESPMIDVRISPNNISCFGVESFARGPVPMYILMKMEEWGCSKYGLDDEYSFLLDSQKQKELFYQNDFPKNVLNLRDYRYVYEHTDAILSYRKRLNLAEKDFCLNIETDRLEKGSKAMLDMQRWMSGTLTAGFVIFCILGPFVAVSIYPVVFCCTSLGYLLSKLMGTLWLSICLVIGVMAYVDILVMFGAMTHYRGIILEMKGYFGEIEGAGCFLDGKTQSVMSDFGVVAEWMTGNLFWYSLGLFLLSTLTIFPSFYLLWRTSKRDV